MESDEKDNEYTDYAIAASYYESHDYISSNNYLLSQSSTDTYSMDMTQLIENDLSGIYFFRMGVINWDESDEEEREENYYGEDNWDIEPYRRQNYNSNSKISQVSGYVMLDIY